MRLLTMHNLTFMALVMRRLRLAIEVGDYANEAKKVLKTGPYDG